MSFGLGFTGGAGRGASPEVVEDTPEPATYTITISSNGIEALTMDVGGVPTNFTVDKTVQSFYVNTVTWEEIATGTPSTREFSYVPADPWHFSQAAKSYTGGNTFTHIYGGDHPLTLSVQVLDEKEQGNGYKITVSVTNNDPLYRITKMQLFNILPITTPSPVTEYAFGVPVTLGIGVVDGVAPWLFRSSPAWGCFCTWPSAEAFLKPGFMRVVVAADPMSVFNWNLYSYATWQDGDELDTPISNGETYTYTFYMKLGTRYDTEKNMAANAATAFRTSYPPLLNWPNRYPIGRMFLGSDGSISVSNPQGAFWDAALNTSDPVAFLAKANTWIANTIAFLATLNPRPQAIIFWDLEGWGHPNLTFAGSPDKLGELYPEMDAIADYLLGRYAAEGYRIGMTLRPHEVVGEDQIYTNSTEEAYTLLHDKIAYAKARWGATVFYVDSTAYTMAGTILDFRIWKRLTEDFPDVLCLPEWCNDYAYGFSAAFRTTTHGVYATRKAARYIYPKAFSVIDLKPVLNPSTITPANYLTVLQARRDGDVFFYEAWYEGANAEVAAVYYQVAAE